MLGTAALGAIIVGGAFAQTVTTDTNETVVPTLGGQDVVKQEDSTANVTVAEPTVTVDLAAPVVTVIVPEPTMKVQQVAPIITIEKGQPVITMVISEPIITVMVLKPVVGVDSAEPEVSVTQPALSSILRGRNRRSPFRIPSLKFASSLQTRTYRSIRPKLQILRLSNVMQT